MRSIFIGCLIISSIILTGCATGMPVSHKNMVLEPITFDETHSYIYFYRPCVIAGAARGITVFEDGDKEDRKIGGLNCDSYFIYQTDPGTHRFYAHDALRTEEVLSFETKAAQKYFVSADLQFGWIDVKPALTLTTGVNEEIVKKLKRVPGY